MRITQVEAIPIRIPLKAGLTTKTAHGEHPVTRAVRMCAPFPASMLMGNDAPLESFQEYAKVPCQTIRREVREDVPTTSALSPQ